MFRTQKEHDFWRLLCSPFPANAYKTRPGSKGQTWTYIPKRPLENRLDEVCGPANWDTKYVIGQRGVTCELTVRYKEYDASGTLTICDDITRSGGGAFRDDLNTADAAEKSAYTTAFRVACSSMGITRDLYQEGMPSFVSDLFGGWASGMPQAQPVTPQPSQPAGGYQGSGGQPQQDGQRQVRFEPPFGKPGRNVYAWAKNVGEFYQFDLLGLMINLATQRGHEKFTDKWTPEFANEAVAAAVVAASRLAHYGGELNQWLPQSQPQQQAPQQQQQQALPMQQQPYAPPGAYANAPLHDQVQQSIINSPPYQQPQAAQAPAPNLSGLKSAIVAQITALIFSKTNRQPGKEELIAAIGEISGAVNDGAGVRGQIMRSMKDCNDAKWLTNMKAYADQAIQATAKQRMFDNQEFDSLPC